MQFSDDIRSFQRSFVHKFKSLSLHPIIRFRRCQTVANANEYRTRNLMASQFLIGETLDLKISRTRCNPSKERGPATSLHGGWEAQQEQQPQQQLVTLNYRMPGYVLCRIWCRMPTQT